MKTVKKSILTILIVAIFSIIILPYSALATGGRQIAYGAADVATSGLRVRSGPSLDHSILTNLNQGTIIVVLERTNSEWYRISYGGTVGYVNTAYINNIREAANFRAVGKVVGTNVNMRERPNTEATIVATYSENSTLNIIGINAGWYKIDQNGIVGYIRSDLIQLTSGGSGSGSSSAELSRGQQIANYAMQFRGVPYVYAGTSPSGFDCSGLVTYVYRQFGIRVSRSATAQWQDNGFEVSRGQLLPGDLVFFKANGGSSINHVGIYIGGGQFIHASSPGVGVVVSNLDSSSYTNRWYGAKRIV